MNDLEAIERALNHAGTDYEVQQTVDGPVVHLRLRAEERQNRLTFHFDSDGTFAQMTLLELKRLKPGEGVDDED